MLSTLKSQLYALMVRGIPFAFYRLPHTNDIHFVAQTKFPLNIYHSYSELKADEQGFLIGPFAPHKHYPLVLIRPDIKVVSLELAHEALNKIMHKVQAYPPYKNIDVDLNEAKDLALSLQHQGSEASFLHYEQIFNLFKQELDSNNCTKLVLSRPKVNALSHNFDMLSAFIYACKHYKGMVSLSYSPYSNLYLGCTPEILVRGEIDNLQTVALAGTMPLKDGVDKDNLPKLSDWSYKNQHEQAVVADYIRSLIKNYSSLKEEQGPFTALAGNVVHLKSEFSFALDNNTFSLGELIDALHPTPAVCGMPKERAYNFIKQYEGYQRGYYSGVIGYYNPQGISELFVNLRCMQLYIEESLAIMIAGGGILSASDVLSEYEETEHKMQAMAQLCSISSNDLKFC